MRVAQQEDLKVLLTAGIDMNQSLKNINEELRQLAKMASGQKITLSVNIEGIAGSISALDSINSKLNQLSANAKTAKEDSSYINKLYEGALDQVTEQIVKFPANLKDEREKQAKAAAESATGRPAAQPGTELDIPPVLRNVSNAATTAAEGTEAFTAAEGGAALASRGLTLALTGLWDVFWPAALLTGVLWGINKITDAVHKHNEEVKEAKTISYDQVDSLKQQKSSLEDLSAEMTNLQGLEDNGTINTDQKKRLLEIQKELVSQYGVSANAVNAEGEAYTTSAAAVNERVKALKNEIDVENNKNRTKLLNQDSDNNNSIKKETNQISDAEAAIKKLKSEAAQINADIASGKISENDLSGPNGMSGSSYKSNLMAIQRSISENEKEIAESKSALQQALDLRINDLNVVSDKYISEMNDKGSVISDTQRAFIREITKSVSSDGKDLATQEKEVTNAINGLQDIKMNGNNIDDLIAKYNKFSEVFQLDPSDKNKNQLDWVRSNIQSILEELAKTNGIKPDFINTIMAMVPGLDQAEAKTNQLAYAVNYYSDYVSKSKKEIQLLNQAQDEMKNTDHLSTGTIEQLNAQYGDFIKVTGLSKDKVLEFLAAKKDEKKSFIEDEIQKTSTLITQTKARIEVMKAERDSALIKDLNTKVSSGNLSDTQAEKLVAAKNRTIDSQNDEFEVQVTKLNVLKDALQELSDGDDAATKKNGSLNDSAGALNSTFSETKQVLTETLERLKEIKDSLADLDAKRSHIKQGSEAYRESLTEENKLLQEQVDLINKGLKDPSELIPKEVPVNPKDGGAKSKASGSKNASSDEEIASTKDNYIQERNDAEEKIYQNKVAYVQDIIKQSEDRQGRFDNLIGQSQYRQSKVSNTSKEYRDEEAVQSYDYQQEIEELKKQNADINKWVKVKGIDSGEFDQKIAENNQKILDLESKVDEKRKNIVNSQIDQYDQNVDNLGNTLSNINAKMGLVKEGSKEYNDLLASTIPILKAQQAEHERSIDYINEQLKSDKLTAADKEKLTKKLQEETGAWLDNAAAIKANTDKQAELREAAADKIIEDYKAMLQKQEDLEEEALDKRTQDENDRHEQVKKNLEDEAKAFEDKINSQLKAMDRLNAQDDYDSELNQKLKERQDLQEKINILSMDTSVEGRSKLKSLQDELGEKDDEISKFKLDHDRDLQKQNLNDQLDNYKDYNGKLSDDEDELNKQNLKAIDNEKKATEQKYKDLLEDDKSFYEMKQGLMSDDATVVQTTLDQIQKGYDGYFSVLKGHVFDTTQEFDNLNNFLQKTLNALHQYSVGNYSQTEYDYSKDSGNSSDSSGSTDDRDAKEQAWIQYLDNKKQAEDDYAALPKAKTPSEYKSLTDDIASLKSENDRLRDKYKFPDKSYDQLVNFNPFSAETGGLTPDWPGSEGKYLLAHQKELILNKEDTSIVLQAVNIAKSFANSFSNWASFMPPTGLFASNSNASTNSNSIELNINIENLNGDQHGVDLLTKGIMKNLNKLGFTN